MSYDYNCTFALDDCLRLLGLDNRGRVQRAVDNEFIRLCDPYVPKDTGLLINSVRIDNGGGEIVWDCESKARRLYYGESSWNWSNGGMQEGGTRGNYWADRAMQAGGIQQLEAVARREAGR